MSNSNHASDSFTNEDKDGGLNIYTALAPVFTHWRRVLVATILSGIAGVGLSYLVTPKFVAATSFLPPQQQQSNAVSALASLGAISGLAGGIGNSKGSADEYIALMQSDTVSDRIIKKFDLKILWGSHFQIDARNTLLNRVIIAASKKDPLIRVSVSDIDPRRAAEIANQYVEELRALTKTIAVTEAQQRRAFFEKLLEQSRDKLAVAQHSLEAGGYTAGALKSEPRSAAEGYSRIRAELTAAEVRLQVLRGSMAEQSAEVQGQQRTMNALAAQLAKVESQDHTQSSSSDYVNRYREFKYQETLFDLFTRQYENARVDESREGALIQVVDPALPPERKNSPVRSAYGAIASILGLLLTSLYFIVRYYQNEAGAKTP